MGGWPTVAKPALHRLAIQREEIRAREIMGVGSCQPTAIWKQLLRRIVKRFRGGLVSEAHRLLHHSTLGSREIKKKIRLATYDGW